MDLSIKKNADISRNRTAMVGTYIMNIVLALAYLMEVVKHTRTLGSYFIVLALCLLPCIISFIVYKRKQDAVSLRYVCGIGFGILYAYIMFTSKTDLVFCYVIVMLMIMVVYIDMKLMVTLGIYSLFVNVAVIVKKVIDGTFNTEALTNAEIMLACILLTFVFIILSIKRISKINTANFEKADMQRIQTEELLDKVLKVGNAISEDIKNATEETVALNTAIKDTQAEMEKLNVGTDDTLSAIHLQKENTDKINNHIYGVDESVGAILSDLKSAETNLDEGNTVMENLLQQVKISEQSNELVAGEMQTLRECTAKMQDIIELISSVARQTSMLALNASIESARAGESGRGFAVVATQISSLAAQTNEATTDINGLIANITESVASVTEAMDQLLESSRLQNEYVGATADSFSKIRENTQNISSQTSQLKEIVDVVIEANGQVNESINNVSNLTNEVVGSADETLSLCNMNLESIAKVSHIMVSLEESAKELKSDSM